MITKFTFHVTFQTLIVSPNTSNYHILVQIAFKVKLRASRGNDILVLKVNDQGSQP